MGVDIQRHNPPSAQLDGGNGQNSGTTSQVQGHGTRVDEFFHYFQASVGCGVVTGAECQPGVKLHQNISGFRLVVDPRGFDDQVVADPQETEMLLPGVLPVRVIVQGGYLQFSQGFENACQFDSHFNVGITLSSIAGKVGAEPDFLRTVILHGQAVPVPVEEVRNWFDILEGYA